MSNRKLHESCQPMDDYTKSLEQMGIPGKLYMGMRHQRSFKKIALEMSSLRLRLHVWHRGSYAKGQSRILVSEIAAILIPPHRDYLYRSDVVVDIPLL